MLNETTLHNIRLYITSKRKTIKKNLVSSYRIIESLWIDSQHKSIKAETMRNAKPKKIPSANNAKITRKNTKSASAPHRRCAHFAIKTSNKCPLPAQSSCVMCFTLCFLCCDTDIKSVAHQTSNRLPTESVESASRSFGSVFDPLRRWSVVSVRFFG